MHAFIYNELLPELQQLVRERLLSGTRALLGMTCKVEVNVFRIHFEAFYRAEVKMIERNAWNADDSETIMRLSLDRLRGCPDPPIFKEDYIPWLPRALAAEGLFGLYANTCGRGRMLSDDRGRIYRDAELAAYHGHGTAMLKWCLASGILHVVARSPRIHRALAATGDSEALRLLFKARHVPETVRAEIIASAICYGQPAIVDEYSQRIDADPLNNVLMEMVVLPVGRSLSAKKLLEGIVLASHTGFLSWIAQMEAQFALMRTQVESDAHAFAARYIDGLLLTANHIAWTGSDYDMPPEIVDRIADLLWVANAHSWFAPVGEFYSDHLEMMIRDARYRLHPGYHDIYEDIRIAYALRAYQHEK